MGQLSLVEHALCPLEGTLGEGSIHKSHYHFVDAARRRRRASVRVSCPAGFTPTDEFYLWGLLGLTLAQPHADSELHATPHYCLRKLNVIDQHARRGGRQYRQFAAALERLSFVAYSNSAFYDPVRGEHRKVSFGFLSYNLPVDPQSSRAWRIAWDPIFFDLARPVGGHLYFDIDTYRELDHASRRLFLLLSKIFRRRRTTGRFDLRHLAVDVMGFASTMATRDLKQKVKRCVRKLAARRIIDASERRSAIKKVAPGEYAVKLKRGIYFETQRRGQTTIGWADSAVVAALNEIGFDEPAVRSLIRRYPIPLLREWSDVTMSARERFGMAYFTKSPQAFFVDNVKHAAQGKRTVPDWWHETRRAELHGKTKPRGPSSVVKLLDPKQFSDPHASENLIEDMTKYFRAAGQSKQQARSNAKRLVREQLRRSSPTSENSG